MLVYHKFHGASVSKGMAVVFVQKIYLKPGFVETIKHNLYLLLMCSLCMLQLFYNVVVNILCETLCGGIQVQIGSTKSHLFAS